MIELDLVQGSKEWIDTRLVNFTASEAPMMMGCSKYISRNQLLDHKKGWTSEVNEFTQKLYDAGHKAEAMARPIASRVANDTFYPVVGLLEDTKYLASFDGLTMIEDIVFEHKLYNKVLAENVLNNVLEPEYYWQLEHQLLVSGADKVLFVCSDGTEGTFYSMWYESVPERRVELIAGWDQFANDLENHQPQAKIEKVEAEPIRDLPAISYKMDGLSLTSNLDVYKQAAMDLVERSKESIETDQDFANAEAMVKVFKPAEDELKALSKRVLSEVTDINAFVQDLEFIGENIRQARLATDKQVKSRKEEIRASIIKESNATINDTIVSAAESANVPVSSFISLLTIDIAGAMKGKKTVESLKDAAATEVAKGKIEITGYLNIAMHNTAVLDAHKDYQFLFNDWQQIAFKAPDDFVALVKTRIADHKESERVKEEAQRERIRLEEEAKIRAENDRKEAARIKAETEATEARKQALRDKEQLEDQVNHRIASNRPIRSNMLVENEKAIQANANDCDKHQSLPPRTLSMAEVKAIIQFISSITRTEQSAFATELKDRAEKYIAQHQIKEAA